MRGYFTVEQIRAAEAALFERVPPGVPMQRAARGLATVVAEELRERTGGVVGRHVGLLVGSGDNGGDALWAGAMLRRRGVAVAAVLLNPERAHKEGLNALRARGGRIAADPPTELADADLVIDGIVGISGTGPLRPAVAELVAAITAPIVAVDLPSGVDTDTGTVSGPAVTAAVTVCPGAYKRVHALAAARCGRIVLVPIGLDLAVSNLSRRSARPGLDLSRRFARPGLDLSRRFARPDAMCSLEPDEVGALWPVPGADDDKYTQGVVGICAGSDRYPGAGVLSVGGAVAATSGMVRYAGSAAAQVLAAHPEVVAAPTVAAAGKVQAWVVGPGAGTDDAALAVLREVLSHDVPVLVDADGLTVLAAHPDLVRGRSAQTLLTPHAGEFHRLTGNDPAADRVAATRALAAEWNVTVLLKGRATVIAAPDGRMFVNDAGGSWAATAGAGDVLSGVVGALLASGLEPAVAAAAGARAHALAANLAASGSGPTAAPVSASALSAQLSAAIRVLRQHATRS